MMPGEPPHDVTTGELWRQSVRIGDDLKTLAGTVSALPAQIVRQLDELMLERLAVVAREAAAERLRVDATFADHLLRLVDLERRADAADEALGTSKLVSRIVLAGCGLILVAVLAAIVGLVVVSH